MARVGLTRYDTRICRIARAPSQMNHGQKPSQKRHPGSTCASSERKRHPYRLRLCSEETPKTPVLLTGRFSADGNMVQELELDGWRFSARLNGKTPHNQLPSNGSAVQVEIGLGYAGLTAYLSEVK